MRENLFEWFPFGAEKKLLQVGGGYGNVTGTLLGVLLTPPPPPRPAPPQIPPP